MRKWTQHFLTVAAIAATLMMTGCAKKAPAPVPAPPAPTTPAPPATPPPVPTPTPPATPPSTVTASDLKTVYFALDSYALDDAARAALDADAKLVRDHDLTVRVEGHCDERGTVEYNMSLGEKRADSVRDYLVGAGVNAARLTTISYGKERPALDGHDESAWSKNRRVEFSKP
jgi:peptidoglycan-associated lipoprotein